jgi:hypothetical protein
MTSSVDRGYHHIDSGNAHLIHQPNGRLPLDMQVVVNKMLKDKEQGITEDLNGWLVVICYAHPQAWESLVLHGQQEGK